MRARRSAIIRTSQIEDPIFRQSANTATAANAPEASLVSPSVMSEEELRSAGAAEHLEAHFEMEALMKTYNPAEGQAYQGDVVVMPLPEGCAIGADAEKIRPAEDGAIVLGEGEVTGHRHAFYERATGFAPDSQRGDGAAVTTGIATLWRDPGLLRRLQQAGLLQDGAEDLHRGFLRVEGGPVALRHEEHDPILIPPGEYYVGGAREMDRAEVRRVAD